MVLDVVAVEVHEEEAHPLVHDLVVRPPLRQLREQEVVVLNRLGSGSRIP